MKDNAEHKDKKSKTLFVRGLTRIEGGSGPTGKKSLGADSSHFTTLIVGEEGCEYTVG